MHYDILLPTLRLSVRICGIATQTLATAAPRSSYCTLSSIRIPSRRPLSSSISQLPVGEAYPDVAEQQAHYFLSFRRECMRNASPEHLCIAHKNLPLMLAVAGANMLGSTAVPASPIIPDVMSTLVSAMLNAWPLQAWSSVR